MSFDYTTGNPNNLVGGQNASMVDVQGPFVDLKTFLNNRIAAIPTLVSSLPVGPADGQEIYYLADAAAGVVWHLRYRSASGSTYKWEFVGGSPIVKPSTASDNTTSTSFVNATNGPSVTPPLAGEYLLEASFVGNHSAAGGGIQYGVSQGGVDLGKPAVIAVSAQAGQNMAITGLQAEPQALTATAITSRIKANNAGTATFSFKAIKLTPVRVG